MKLPSADHDEFIPFPPRPASERHADVLSGCGCMAAVWRRDRHPRPSASVRLGFRGNPARDDTGRAFRAARALMARISNRANREVTRASRELASTLEYYREASDLTKKDFAEKLGITTQFLDLLLRGTGNPTLELMEAMADKLDLEFSPLFRAPTSRAVVFRPRRKPAAPEATEPQRASKSRSSTETKRQPPRSE